MKNFGIALGVRTVIAVALVFIGAAVAFYLGASVTDYGLYVLEGCIACLVMDLLTFWWNKRRYFGALCYVVEQVLAVHKFLDLEGLPAADPEQLTTSELLRRVKLLAEDRGKCRGGRYVAISERDIALKALKSLERVSGRSVGDPRWRQNQLDKARETFTETAGLQKPEIPTSEEVKEFRKDALGGVIATQEGMEKALEVEADELF